MSGHPAHRGDRRIRVALEVRPRSTRVVGVAALDGPAVQRPALDGTHVAEVRVAGEVVLLQSFDDPLMERGIAPPGERGHSFARTDAAVIHVDVPVRHGEVPGEIEIRIADVSGVEGRPTHPDGLRAALEARPRGVRTIAEIATPQLVAHPDWAEAGLGGASTSASTGSFEIFVDRRGRYRWRLRKPGGEIVAVSGEGFRERAECEADLRWIRQRGASAPVRSLDLP